MIEKKNSMRKFETSKMVISIRNKTNSCENLFVNNSFDDQINKDQRTNSLN